MIEDQEPFEGEALLDAKCFKWCCICLEIELFRLWIGSFWKSLLVPCVYVDMIYPQCELVKVCGMLRIFGLSCVPCSCIFLVLFSYFVEIWIIRQSFSIESWETKVQALRACSCCLCLSSFELFKWLLFILLKKVVTIHFFCGGNWKASPVRSVRHVGGVQLCREEIEI
jgi:hypothetical protein